MEDISFSASDLAVGYRGKTLISGISFELRRGQICALVGPNGAGKSTILRSVTRHLAPLAGVVHIGGEEAARMSAPELARRVSVVLTERVRPELMTCFEVAAAGRYPYTGCFGRLTSHDREVVRQSLSMVHALDLAEQDFRFLSDGQRQRVLLARAICQEPEVMVLDEPTSYLDIRHKAELLSILQQLSHERGTTIILSLHELDLAARVADVVLLMGEHSIELAGRSEDVLTAENIGRVYGLDAGRYDAMYGSLELERPAGEPRIFVLGGAGRGIPVYRALQKRRLPFAAGILFENDLDMPVARALASKVFAAKAFEPVPEELYCRAEAAMRRCGVLLDTGVRHPANERLLDEAKRSNMKIVREVSDVSD